jgi:hypothetical protein
LNVVPSQVSFREPRRHAIAPYTAGGSANRLCVHHYGKAVARSPFGAGTISARTENADMPRMRAAPEPERKNMSRAKSAGSSRSVEVNTIKVIVETPRGSRNKYKYERRLKRFRLKSVLPSGTEFPYDFGFVPKTRAADGDPLDVLVLMDEGTFPGCVVEVRLIGVFEARQTEARAASATIAWWASPSRRKTIEMCATSATSNRTCGPNSNCSLPRTVGSTARKYPSLPVADRKPPGDC